MSERFERTLSSMLVIAALIIAGTLVHREFLAASPHQLAVGSAGQGMSFEPRWEEAFPVGVRVGNPNAAVKVIEFADLECPSCRFFQSTLDEAMRLHPNEVSVAYVSFPLPQHRFAVPAARAAECAEAAGRFGEFIRLVYAKQDSLGLKTWASYAVEAGIPDSLGFQRCASAAVTPKRVADGRAMGEKIGLRGTPTVIVNGWRFPGSPGREEFLRVVDDLLHGKPPLDTTKAQSGARAVEGLARAATSADAAERSILATLFKGIQLTEEQVKAARQIISSENAAQGALDRRAPGSWEMRAQLNRQRDSTLRALLTSATYMAQFDANASQLRPLR